MEQLKQRELKQILYYDPVTGIFIWKVGNGVNTKAGDIAGCLSSLGYVLIGVNKKTYLAHRLAWLYMEGFFPTSIDIDHINRIRNDNRWENLRLVSRSCNSRNCNLSKNNKSGINGVSFHKKTGKWQTTIYVNNKYYYLGIYSDFNEAVLVRLAVEQCLNWEGCNTTSSAYLYAKNNKLVN